MNSAALSPLPVPDGRTAGTIPAVADSETFAALYDEHVAFVVRGVRRLGVHESAIEDVVQDIFLTAYRRLASFRQDSSMRTWLFGILIRVVRLHRRTNVRARLHGVLEASSDGDTEGVADTKTRRPDDEAETKDAWRMLLRALDELDDEKREVFVLAELEELSMPAIATLLDLKLNTAYSRLRLARVAFEKAVARMRESP